jgi:hypothetical protein
MFLHNFLNVLFQIANKMGLLKILFRSSSESSEILYQQNVPCEGDGVDS